MFPSSGYFRGINCPFYISGLCERPYCHFRHSKPNESKGSPLLSIKSSKENYSTSSSSFTPTQQSYSTAVTSSYNQNEITSYLTAAPQTPSGPIESYSTSLSSPLIEDQSSNVCIPAFTSSAQHLPEGDEEPIPLGSLPKISGLPKSRQENSPLSYKPTPKQRSPSADTLNETPSYKPTPKGHLINKKNLSRVIEYDPVNNFAFPQGEREEEEEENHGGNVNGQHSPAVFSDSENADSEGEEGGQTSASTDVDKSSQKAVVDYASFLTPSSFFIRQHSAPDPEVRKKAPSQEDSVHQSSVKTSKVHLSRSESSHSHGNKVYHSSCSGSKKDKHHNKDTSSKSSHSSHRKKDHSHQNSPGKGDSSSNTAKSSSLHKSSQKRSSSHDERNSSLTSNSHHKSHKQPNHGQGSCERKNSSSKDSVVSVQKSTSSSKDKQALSKQHSSAKSSSSCKENSLSKSISTSTDGSRKSFSTSSSSAHRSNLDNDKKVKKDQGSSLPTHHTNSSAEKNGKHKHRKSNTSERDREKRKSTDSSRKSNQNQSSCDNIAVVKQEKRIALEDKDKDVSSNSGSHNAPSHPDISQISSVKKEDKESSQKQIGHLTSGPVDHEYDSDVEIVSPPPEPPPEVYELTDSDEDLSNIDTDLSEEVDFITDSDTFDECLRIFQENEKKMADSAARQKENIKVKQEHSEPKPSKTSDSLLESVGKKRMAHKAASQISRASKSLQPSRPRLSPAEVMHNRILEMQKKALLRAAKREGREAELPAEMSPTKAKVKKPNPFSSPAKASVVAVQSTLTQAAQSLLSQQKKRTAHTPTPTPSTPVKSTTSPAAATWSPNSFYTKKKKPEEEGTSQRKVPSTTKKTVTIASTASKTEKRKAHEPNMTNLARPLIPTEFGSKVPTNVRQRYLNLIIDEFLKFCPEKTAYDRAQEEEKQVYTRSSNKNIYLRVVVNCIKKIRTEANESLPSTSKRPCLNGPSHVSQSHAATLGGAPAARTSYTLNRLGSKSQPVDYKGVELYKRLEKYIMSEEELRDNGFPRPSEDGSSQAKYYKERETKDVFLKENERICRRCGKRFYVAKDGGPISFEECVYHWGNAYKKKYAGSIDSRYVCCNERAGTKGCQVAKSHVHEHNKTENRSGYMRTMPDTDPKKNTRVLSLDCEMVYTKAGLELARVTVVDDTLSVVYETLVKPDTEVIDYNTRFSGITESDLQGVTTTLRGVQAVMLSMVSDKTILMGHSLESDLVALKMIHSTVVDTSLVFPHRLGLPYKRALRQLMVEFLQKIIQADDSGHDSKEDALACMQLMIYKVKDDAKGEIRRV